MNKRVLSLSSATIAAIIAGAAFLAAPMNTHAADIKAEQSAAIYDLLNPLLEVETPAGVDKEIYKKAVKALADEKLLSGGSRPNYDEKGVLEKYGNALLLGARAKDFAADIARIHDLVNAGDPKALKTALTDLWLKAGRARPDDAALDPVLDKLYGAKGAEPQETVRHKVSRPDHDIEIMHGRAGGVMQISVSGKDEKGNVTDRTVFQGATKTVPSEDGKELEREIKLNDICTSTEKTDKETFGQLAGKWTGNTGGEWEISGAPDALVLTDLSDERRLTYTGTYSRGRIYAEHLITKASDIQESLPAAVRQQIAAMGNQTFRISLEVCGKNESDLTGTWSSQHVTYDGMTLTVSRIHDPYDNSLVLSRAVKTKTAQGAARDTRL